ncbi:triacylglycerol lipase [Malassezia vespertilionis]|uniref:DUF676 domain-containing protein n=1 Tax=Malassezia vespertilionis TaxID=2020962 RepID=A0A2N1JDW0_9BASI|nr:triacylglycerol lipase [Malassezia vespertilionis]PKI84738.1 hypothetical protein MVES_001155 [Malassezia vespertilionis]WFD05891.1 triacylglycerol lipase [Malassezia vespertilionis]
MRRARCIPLALWRVPKRQLGTSRVVLNRSAGTRRNEIGKAEKVKKKAAWASKGSKLDQLMRDPSLYTPIRKPRLPIVLCHGLYGFDVRGPFLGLEYHYWSTTLDILRDQIGADVLVVSVPPTGSIKERAEALHKFLADPANGVRGKRINFVGHSMGGLDVRYIISTIKPKPEEYTPASLTTLSTPHRGSPFMDWCNANIGIGVDLIDDLMQEARVVTPNAPELPHLPPFSLKSPLFARKDNKKNSGSDASALASITSVLNSVSSALSSYILATFDQPAYAMLSTRHMTRLFNPRTPDDPSVRYFSVAARANELSVIHPLWLPKLILDKAAATNTSGGEMDGSSDALGGSLQGNDGLVSIRSAQWGTFLGIMEGWDHWDVRGAGGPRRIRSAKSMPKARVHLKPDKASALNLFQAGWARLTEAAQAWRRPSTPTSQAAPEDAYWNWLDAALSDYNDPGPNRSATSELDAPPAAAAVYAMASAYEKYAPKKLSSKRDAEIAQRVAKWISSHLPHDADGASSYKDDMRNVYMYLSEPRHSLMLPAPPAQEAPNSDPPSPAPHLVRNDEARRTANAKQKGFPNDILAMLPFLSQHQENTSSPPQLVLEHFWLAICRNLYDEGL